MQRLLAAAGCVYVLLAAAVATAQLGAAIENPTGKYLVWNDYKVEINQYGGLGRDWPQDIVWKQYELLDQRAKANPEPPNTIKAVLLVCPTTEATAVKKEDDKEVEVGTKTTAMTSAEVKWALEQWRQWEEMVYVYSGGNAWLRTDLKVIDEPLKVRTNEDWGFWSGPKNELLDKYMPFERGDYDSYNSIYNGKDLKPGPWGGTFGADLGPKGCGSSDNAWLSREKADERHGFVFWHEWLNQMCWATSNVMPYPQELWSLYVFANNGYRDDPINAWPWITSHRDMMRFAIRPGMWKRWTVTDPYISPAIDTWEIFGPGDEPPETARELSQPNVHGTLLKMKLGTYDQFNLAKAEPAGATGAWEQGKVGQGIYFFRTFVSSLTTQDVRLWAGADERFQLWLNGVMVRDGWGTLRSTDQGRLVEKVTYTTLEAGVNTLVLVVPNVDEQSKDLVEFRVRFCKPDGSGQQPDGVTYSPGGVAGKIVPLKDPVVQTWKNPTLYTWADVGDDPWLLLPRLDEKALRELTGIETLAIKTQGVPYTVTVKDAEGKDVERKIEPKQHLFFDVPQGAVTSPRVAQPTENAEALNNDLDFNWESLAWLRVPGRPGQAKDVVFVRFDVAEPVLHLLKTKGRAADESLVGYVLVEHKIVYVALVELDGAPTRELEALSKKPE
jgi:hypothetical protein